MNDRRIDLIAVPSALGAPDEGAAGGPEALRGAGLLTALHRAGRKAAWTRHLPPPLGEDRWEDLQALCARLAAAVADSISGGAMPLVVGGDHSIAAGTWRGAAEALAAPPGLIWIDAHLDAHTRQDSLSGNPHGMPLALLLGEGDPRLARRVLSPERVCVVGARDWEPEEAHRLARRGVRVYDDDEIARRGLGAVMAEALERVADEGGAFGVSFDIDVLDPREAPGVSTPAYGGRLASEWIESLRGIADRPGCVALELVECNPARDADGRAARIAVRLAEALFAPPAARMMELESAHGANNYDPLPVVLSHAAGCRVWDVEGREYLDMMSAYSAASFGHAHPRLVATLTEQASRLAVTSRAFYNDRLPAFLRRLTELTGYERALPVNTGLEAVETALKAARKWGHTVKGIAPERAEIIACEGNFHGRSIAIVGFSSESQYREGFGPFPPGFKLIPYGDEGALEAAIAPETAAFLVEPIQCEGGIVVPPDGYLSACAEICRRNGVLLICDEIQTGLGRTGRLLACEHENVRPDAVVLGKALGGGLYPVSAFLADDDVMRVFAPGDHGSTFGGNALGAAVALTALDILVEEHLADRAATQGAWLMKQLNAIQTPVIREVRGRGLLIGVETEPGIVGARALAEALLAAGILTKDTHGTVIRLAPPLTIGDGDLAFAVKRIAEACAEIERRYPRAA